MISVGEKEKYLLFNLKIPRDRDFSAEGRILQREKYYKRIWRIEDILLPSLQVLSYI